MQTILTQGFVITAYYRDMAIEAVTGIHNTLKQKYSPENPNDFELVNHVNAAYVDPSFDETLGGNGPNIDYWISRQLARIFSVTSSIEGKTILDLGCGSNTETEDIKGSPSNQGNLSIWNPWLCRALYELGANPIGVDFGSLEGEEFEHYSHVDLMTESLLTYLKPSSVDLAHNQATLPSSQMNALHGEDVITTFKDKVIPALDQIVKAEGFFLFDSNLEPA